LLLLGNGEGLAAMEKAVEVIKVRKVMLFGRIMDIQECDPERIGTGCVPDPQQIGAVHWLVCCHAQPLLRQTAR